MILGWGTYQTEDTLLRNLQFVWKRNDTKNRTWVNVQEGTFVGNKLQTYKFKKKKDGSNDFKKKYLIMSRK